MESGEPVEEYELVMSDDLMAHYDEAYCTKMSAGDEMGICDELELCDAQEDYGDLEGCEMEVDCMRKNVGDFVSDVEKEDYKPVACQTMTGVLQLIDVLLYESLY